MNNNNLGKIYLKIIGYSVGLLISIGFAIYSFVKFKNNYLGILFLIGALYCLIETIQYIYVITNKNQLIVTALCLNNKMASLGFGMTSSKIYNFKILNLEELKNDYLIEENEFEIQVPIDNIKDIKKTKGPLKNDAVYEFVFSKPKDNTKQLVLSNRNMVCYTELFSTYEQYLNINKTDDDSTQDEELSENEELLNDDVDNNTSNENKES